MTDLPDQLKQCAGGLTIKDPWAQAIIFGPKRIENRTWRPPAKVVGERIAIGVSQEMDSDIIDRLHRAHICQEGSDRKVRPEDWGDWRLVSFGSDHHPGHIIGTVRVRGYIAPDDDRHCAVSRYEDDHWGDEYIAWQNRDDESEGLPEFLARRSNWFTGPTGWLLDDPKPLDAPIPVRGMPGIWDVAKQIQEARQ